MTKHLRFFLSFLVALALVLASAGFPGLPAARAEGTAEPEDWDSLIEQFLADHRVSPEQVAIGFYNTVTGEEHYLRGDEYMETGSTYKVPLNMVYAERIYNGEMDFDTKIAGAKYEFLQYMTIVRSNNEYATYLWQELGEYGTFRNAIAGYMGVDPETVEPKYYRNRFFTARQVVNCLKTLYAEPERFPGVIDCMLLAEPENYFNHHPQNYPIAHKYGYIEEDGILHLCDSGICYTDDPIIIVMFTEGVSRPNAFLADYCTLMCDYAERTRAERLAREEAENAAALPAAVPVPPPKDAFPAAPTGAEATEPAVKEKMPLMPIILIVITVAAALCAVIAAAKRKRIRPVSGVLSVLFASAALVLCFTGMTRGTLFTRTEGDPRDAVTGFLDAVLAGDSGTACGFLADYADLGLDAVPDDPVSAEMIRALRESYAYEITGDCVTDGLTAKQTVLLRHLDFSKMAADLQSSTNECVRLLVERLSKEEIYDADGGYRGDFVSRAYADAVEMTLSHKEDYTSSDSIELDLIFRNGRWLIRTDPELLSALCGGT